MDELIDILDENGNSTGRTCLKSKAHLKGLFHPTVHVWFYTCDGSILFQKRAHDKDTFPSLWDVSVAGHIGAGEDFVLAALRETEEEIGLSIESSDLKEIGIFRSQHKHSDTLIDNEFHHVFICELKVPLSNLKRQESEVDDVQLFSLTGFKTRVTENQLEGFVPHERNYYHLVIAEIEKEFNS
ncbi:NUDIX domain-containing protein [Flagellimonas sp. S3867]|uniref:NUDIX hydrolase n=1 Tax=Flagellimonas sp. S3867 TaxID=2768063 RepID=UPI00168744A2|nr:NUDIX domain-containing protein [Flagellimonas sp. S3867]